MIRKLVATMTLVLMSHLELISQQTRPLSSSFESVEFQRSPAGPYRFMRGGKIAVGSFEARTATLLDLIRVGYGVGAENIVGGPSWLGWDRFDISAKLPPGSTDRDLPGMLQDFLSKTFRLRVHSAASPKQRYRVSATPDRLRGARLGSAAVPPVCEFRTASGPGTAVIDCRSTTMEQFTRYLKQTFDVNLPIVDATNIDSSWDFTLQWSIGEVREFPSPNLTKALEDQLGLRIDLEETSAPMIVVDSATEIPRTDAMKITRLLSPKEFELATIKPTAPDTPRSVRLGERQITWTAFSLKDLIAYSWMVAPKDELMSGIPSWASSAKFDIAAKTPDDWPSPKVDIEIFRPMLLRLLQDRFGLKAHVENRTIPAYSLQSAKPKLKNADPSRGTSCGGDEHSSLPYRAGGTITCTNISMDEFAEELQIMTAYFIPTPVLNSTGLNGRWDFSISFSGFQRFVAPTASTSKSAPPVPGLAEGPPTFFEALEEQLGLKLVLAKRPVPVLVVDRINRTPSEN